MASELDDLKTRRATIASELAALASKPDYSLDGQSVQWSAHRKALIEEYRSLNELILLLEPYEVHIQGQA